MKVLFLKMLLDRPTFLMGIAVLSSSLKARGHDSAISYIDFSKKGWEEKIGKDLRVNNPDLVCFSVTEADDRFLGPAAKLVKEKSGKKVAIGGPYATLCSQELIQRKEIDVVFFGEAEKSLPDFLDILERQKKLPKNVPGTAVKDASGKIIFNRPPNLVDIEKLPFPDWDLMDESVLFEYSPREKTRAIMVQASRGCPFPCSFCSNGAMKLRGLAPKERANYHRTKSPERIISEINAAREKYSFKYIYFNDDVFWMDTDWLAKFLYLFRKEIGLPFFVQNRVELINSSSAKALAKAGCDRFGFGIDAGNENFRKRVLLRTYSNKAVIGAARVLKYTGIKTIVNNIIGLPYETPRLANETFELNVKAGPDEAYTSIFYPLKGTPLGELCYKNGWVKQESARTVNLFVSCILNMPQFKSEEIERLAKTFPARYAFARGRFIEAGRFFLWDIVSSRYEKAKRVANSDN